MAKRPRRHPSENGDPFRDYILRALEKLLKDSDRSDERWAEQEMRWAEEKERWVAAEARAAARHEDLIRAMALFRDKFDEGQRLNIAALKSVLASLKDVEAGLRSLRRPRAGGGNGR